MGALAYLSVVAAVAAAVFLGVSSVERSMPGEAPVLARGADEPGARPERGPEAVAIDADRVPVWIAPTAKYAYTPVPIEHKTKPGSVIDQEARAAMAKARSSRQDGRRAIEQRWARPGAIAGGLSASRARATTIRSTGINRRRSRRVRAILADINRSVNHRSCKPERGDSCEVAR